MLSACGGSGERLTATTPGTAAVPVVTTRTQVVRVCPPELQQALGAKPAPAVGAEVRFNAAGGEYLAARNAWGDRAAALFADAQRACPP